MLLIISPRTTNAQANCTSAPTEAIQIMCQEITQWAMISRNVPSKTRTHEESPIPTGLFGQQAVRPAARNAYECMDTACLCRFLGGTGGSNCVLASGRRLRRVTRKEYRVLTDDERRRYHAAMWTIKRNGDYDALSRIHSQFFTSPGAHSGPAFLPWHRELIKRLEIALRRVDPSVALPYWDSTLDERLPNPRDSSLWSDELMGTHGADGAVRTGAFRNWLTVDGRRVFKRSIGTVGNLMTDREIATVVGTSDYRQVLASTAPQRGCRYPANWEALEYVHGGPHVYSGGDMLVTTSSTNDPLFFNHHSMVDLIWEMWRVSRQTRTQRETQYPSDNSLCNSRAHFANTIMAPFSPMVNLDGLSNQYTDNLYQYDPRPRCSRSNPSRCASKYLFCDLSHGNPQCASKIVIGGRCGGYRNNEDRCYLGRCVNNICVRDPRLTAEPLNLTTTSAVPMEETCFNELQCCSIWARNGECERDPSYMDLWCKASCGICTPTTYDLNTECSDRHVRCVSRRDQGECDSNLSWMMENCRDACGACVLTRLQTCNSRGTTPSTTRTRTTSTTAIVTPTTARTTPTATRTTPTSTRTTSASTRTTPTATRTISTLTATTTRAVSTNDGCLNQDYCCIAWASRGHCNEPNLRSYMVKNCQPACDVCNGAPGTRSWDTHACANFHPSCTAWTTQGYCNASRAYMWENCRQSCGACMVSTLSTRLSLCGFSDRLNTEGHPVIRSPTQLNSDV